MNRDDFQLMMDRQFDLITNINRTKGKDYSGDEDAFLNFKRQAETLGLEPEQIWAVYASKHWDAIMTYCREGQVASEPIENRLQDIILYSFLLLGMAIEKRAAQKEAGV